MLNKYTLNNDSFRTTIALALVHKIVVLPIMLSQRTGPCLKLDANLASILHNSRQHQKFSNQNREIFRIQKFKTSKVGKRKDFSEVSLEQI